MRRLVIASVLTGCVTVAAMGVVSAQSSSSPETTGQRVELPDVGLAITLPKGWRVNVAWSSADFVSFDYLWALESCSLSRVDPNPHPDSDAIPLIYHEEVLASTDVDLPAGPAVRTDSVIGEVFLVRHHTVFVAAYSALRRVPVAPALLVLGDMSIQGNIKALPSVIEPLQVAMDNGAKRALLPIENKRSFLEVPGDVVEHVDPIFYGDPRTAAMKAMGLS